MELPGSRANEFRSKHCVKLVAKHLMPHDWTLKQKTEKLTEFFNNLNPTEEGIESQVVKKLQIEVGGEREVACDGGFIDLLTKDTIFEVKRDKDWKGALGQVLVYGETYPKHIKYLFLFGEKEISNERNEFISKICNKYDVRVIFKMIEKV